MNDAVQVPAEGLLTTSDLAARPELTIGGVIISPSTRKLRGPEGSVDVEPRVMQVLVVLADAAGQVVTRETLFNRCWGGVYVGDDSLNRAVAALRRAVEAVGGRFEVETIPRTGYQLTIPKRDAQDSTAGPPINRRGALVAGGAALAALGAAGWWWTARETSDPGFEALMARGDEALRSGTFEEDPHVVGLYEQAVRLEPGNARAWGLLAYLKSAQLQDGGPTRQKGAGRTALASGPLAEQAQDTIERALGIDPKEPNALLARVLLQGPMVDWATRDRRLRAILSIAPQNTLAISELMSLVQAAGLNGESWRWNEQILQLLPMSRPHLVIRAMKLWILRRVTDSDRVIDRVRGLWPDYRFAFSVRIMLFILTGRPSAGLAMLDGAPPGMIADAQLWRAAAKAVEYPSPQTLEGARDACLAVAKDMPWKVNNAVMILCALGQKDLAFEMTDGYLLWRGKVVSASKADGSYVNDYSRRMTQWLFTPPAAIMRADPRFLRLCEDFGLADYWRARGVKPDYMRS